MIYSGYFVIMLMLYDINAFKTDFSSMVAGVINPAKRPDTIDTLTVQICAYQSKRNMDGGVP